MMDEHDRPEPPDCNICGHRLRIANVLPKLGPHKELVTLKCDNCGEVHSVWIDGDKSDEE